MLVVHLNMSCTGCGWGPNKYIPFHKQAFIFSGQVLIRTYGRGGPRLEHPRFLDMAGLDGCGRTARGRQGALGSGRFLLYPPLKDHAK